MLVTNCNHIFLLDNGEGNHLFFFGEFLALLNIVIDRYQRFTNKLLLLFLANVGHLGKVSTFAENLRLLSVGFEI